MRVLYAIHYIHLKGTYRNLGFAWNGTQIMEKPLSTSSVHEYHSFPMIQWSVFHLSNFAYLLFAVGLSMGLPSVSANSNTIQ